ncbi:hypothetical protein SAMN05421736_10455 [Evansella caseinilytica]|uniref:Uncharacterized protein n=1 Tax=Evansella caseinilytica TaxID=1503961 RepID=A0A1H3NHC3_9BACI|nr:hypothetical protein [Evansella caseinilytica]SDY87619.1 hypothetical protein SAMN05421736_10455 [Evansella caseinilytica]
MKLMNILLTQPQTELVNRVKALGLTCDAHSRQQLTEQLAKALLNKAHAEKEWQEMKTAEQQLLTQMSYGSMFASYTTNELFTCVKRSERAQFDRIVESLKSKGWIYREASGVWHLPLELKDWIKNYTYQVFRQHFILFPDAGTSRSDIIGDLFQFMEHLAENGVRLTKNKTIHKKELAAILRSQSKQEEIPAEKWRFGYGRHFYYYPDRFSFLYDFCCDQGWIDEGENLEVTPAWDSGQEISVNELLERLCRFYLRLYSRVIPQLPFLLELIRGVFPDNEGMEEQQLIFLLKQYIDPYYYDEPETIIKIRIIQMLEYIGVVEIKEMDAAKYVLLQPRSTIKNKKKV